MIRFPHLFLLVCLLPLFTACGSAEKDPYALRASGLKKQYRGNLEGAIADFTAAIEAEPSAENHRLRAEALMEAKRWKEAIRDLVVVLEHHPEDHRAHLRLGTCLEETGQVEIAFQSYAEAHRLAPDWEPAAEARARAAEKGYGHLFVRSAKGSRNEKDNEDRFALGPDGVGGSRRRKRKKPAKKSKPAVEKKKEAERTKSKASRKKEDESSGPAVEPTESDAKPETEQKPEETSEAEVETASTEDSGSEEKEPESEEESDEEVPESEDEEESDEAESDDVPLKEHPFFQKARTLIDRGDAHYKKSFPGMEKADEELEIAKKAYTKARDRIYRLLDLYGETELLQELGTHVQKRLYDCLKRSKL